MTKQEFIDRLRAALNGRIPTAKVTDTINYYEDYINTEIRKGRSEEEVLASLGDPRLIAKTIIQTTSKTDTAAQSAGYQRDEQESTYQSSEYRKDYGQYSGSYSDERYGGMRTTKIPGWLLAIIMMIVILFVVSVVFSLLSFLAPLIFVMVGVLFMVKLFRDWLN